MYGILSSRTKYFCRLVESKTKKKERIDARAIRAFSSFYSFCFVSVSLNETEKKQVERWKR